MAYTDEHGEMDIIFAGGGTAACIAAGRLAAANPDLKILLVEGGPDSLNNPTIVNPAAFLTHLQPDSKTALFYKARADPNLNGREAIVPMGGVLGGGSSINFMMYTRAQGDDFDAWKTEGWSAKEVLPYLKKLETYHFDHPKVDKSLHGYDGPIHISDGGFRSQKAEDKFIETVKGMGYDEIVDLQDLEAVNGFSRWQRYVSPDGKRQDTAHRYVHPLMADGKHPNLHILVQSKVVRVLFDQSTPPKAIGVECVTNEEHQPAVALSKPGLRTIKASKLVVVSAGALGTPQILERSGVGSEKILSKLSIPVVSDVKGVGEAYQDHHLILYPYASSLEPEETLDCLLNGGKDFAQALGSGDKMLGWNAIDVCSKLRPTEEEVQVLGKEFQKDWDRDFKNRPTRPMMLMGVVDSFLADPSLVDKGQYFTLGNYTAYPYSRGSIHITSKDNVLDGYDFDTGFLNHPSDILKHLWAYKRSREIARRLPYYRGEVEFGHPSFKEGSAAAAKRHPNGLEVKADIEYSKEDDEAILDWIRGNLNTTWHSLGTCAMRPQQDGGVVDPKLNVYGTKGLKLCDLSIVPENVGANTNNTALLVGEKAAAIIGEELGIKV